MLEEWYETTVLAAVLRGEHVYERKLVPDEDNPGELREESDDELRARIKRDLENPE